MATEPTEQAYGPPPPTYTPTIYQQIANEFMNALDLIMPAIPKPKPSHIHTLDYFRSYLNVPEPFLNTTVSAVSDMPELQVLEKLDPFEGRDTLQFMEAFRPVFMKLEAFEKSLKFVYDARKASLAWDALEIYDIAKVLARRTGNVRLKSLVESMKRELGTRGRPKLTRAARKAAAEAEAAEMEEGVNPS